MWRGVAIWRVVEGQVVAGWPVSEALAASQARLSDGHVGQFASRGFTVTDELPDQVPGRQALAAYQSRLSDLWR
jgi:hypothetical protein